MSRPSARDLAVGKWPGILEGLGIDRGLLTGRHTRCPICKEGKDRFRFDDLDGKGTFFCSKCGAGDGFDLAMRATGREFLDVAQEVEKLAPTVPKVRTAARRLVSGKALQRLWLEARPLADGDAVTAYLSGRRLPIPFGCKVLRCHPSLAYRDGDKQVIGHFPAMLAAFQAPDGTTTAIARTFLGNGPKGKAPVPEAKKTLGAMDNGGAVRLFPVAPVLGVAEGVESALKAAEIFDMPVWATISAHGMETFLPPAGVEEVWFLGDRDSSFTGQKAAYTGAFRMHAKGYRAQVRLPSTTDMDWAD